MWQPTRPQWFVVYLVALVVVLAWPPDTGRSLGAKLANWLADPRGELPAPPPSLPMALDDDGDAVAEHDTLESAYQIVRARSNVTRLRMDLKDAGDPFERSTQRQLLVGLVVLGGLYIWRAEVGRAH